ncbi:MAG: thioredoxin family protein [Thermodesulfobacteriota bacterium]|nr:thioredoxin family protein [Thermodesulfobacteriota bacterium]
MKHRLSVTLAGSVLLLALTTGTLPAAEQTTDFDSVPVKGMVTMIDLGAKKCIPCKMMAPIMEKIDKVYDGKAAIVFIDVWKHREQAKRFGIRAIPTQIFFDSDGKEIYRHAGFMGEKDIIAQLEKMGVGRGEKTDA